MQNESNLKTQPNSEPTDKSKDQLTAAPTSNTKNNTSDNNMLAIIGIVLAFFMAPVGLVVSIIALVQSKKAGQKNTLAVVGIIINAIFTLMIIIGVVLMIFFGVFMFNMFSQANKNDQIRKDNVNYIGGQIEKYNQINGAYPRNLSELTVMAGFDTASLNDPQGSIYNYELYPTGCNPTLTCTGFKVYTKPQVVVNGVEELNYTSN